MEMVEVPEEIWGKGRELRVLKEEVWEWLRRRMMLVW